MTKKPDRYWNYRIIYDPNTALERGAFLGLYEVHYENGVPVAWEETPTCFVAGPDEGKQGITGALKLAMKAGDKPVLKIVSYTDGLEVQAEAPKQKLIELSEREFRKLVRAARQELDEKIEKIDLTEQPSLRPLVAKATKKRKRSV
jgi:hypothetical protein